MKKTKKSRMEENKKLIPYFIIFFVIGLILYIFEGIIVSILKMIFWIILIIFAFKISKKK